MGELRKPWVVVASAALLLSASATVGSPPGDEEGPWSTLEPGLELGIFDAPQKSPIGDSRVRVLRIDPARFRLQLHNASAPGEGSPRTAREWCRRHDLAAAINASMYQRDHLTSVSLMRSKTHINNGRLSKDKAILAFDPLEPMLPEVQIIDRECQDFSELRHQYQTLVQSIRMVSCRKENVWKQQPAKWSTAAIGMDGEGRPLFIHVRSPYTTHDLINILLGLPISLHNALYAEGGAEAQLYINSGGHEFEFVGTSEKAFRLGEGTHRAWPVPNVVGLARKTGARPLTRP